MLIGDLHVVNVLLYVTKHILIMQHIHNGTHKTYVRFEILVTANVNGYGILGCEVV
jgi:hypothetical protein